MTALPKLSGTLGFFGFGNMGSALARGMVSVGRISPNQILVLDPLLPESIKVDLAASGYRFAGLPDQLFNESEIVVLAIKPQIAKEERENWRAIFEHIHGNKVFISIMAGVKAAYLRSIFSPSIAVRVMPNLGLSVGEGATAIATDGLSEESLQLVESIFQSCGQTVRVSEEQMDAVTGVSGSGPMYVFEFIEALTQAGVDSGLERQTAYRLAVQTAKGSIKILENSLDLPSTWSARVRSPGGTTAEAQKVLEDEGFHALLIRAVKAAVKRSKELSE